MAERNRRQAYREIPVMDREAMPLSTSKEDAQTVSEREQPREEDGVLVIPIYEEQLVVTKRLVLKERMRVRRVGTTERQLFEDTLRRERLIVEDRQHTELVREQYPTEHLADGAARAHPDAADSDSGFLENLVRKALE